MAAEQGFRVFYRDYVHEVSIPSTAPEFLAADRVAPLAERLLVRADNFLGILDEGDLVLQVYLDDDESQVVLDLLYPESGGCLRLTAGFDWTLDLLSRLPAGFDERLLPGSSFVG